MPLSPRYDARQSLVDDTWLVIDVRTGEVAHVNGIPQQQMSMEDADDLADLLNAVRHHSEIVSRSIETLRAPGTAAQKIEGEKPAGSSVCGPAECAKFLLALDRLQAALDDFDNSTGPTLNWEDVVSALVQAYAKWPSLDRDAAACSTLIREKWPWEKVVAPAIESLQGFLEKGI